MKLNEHVQPNNMHQQHLNKCGLDTCLSWISQLKHTLTHHWDLIYNTKFIIAIQIYANSCKVLDCARAASRHCECLQHDGQSQPLPMSMHTNVISKHANTPAAIILWQRKTVSSWSKSCILQSHHLAALHLSSKRIFKHRNKITHCASELMMVPRLLELNGNARCIFIICA